jgi:hypothetical protein
VHAFACARQQPLCEPLAIAAGEPLPTLDVDVVGRVIDGIEHDSASRGCASEHFEAIAAQHRKIQRARQCAQLRPTRGFAKTAG